MSYPVNLQALPAAVFQQVPSPQNVEGRPTSQPRTSLVFPKSRRCLWDGRPAGEKFCIQLCSRRMPRLLLHEKALSLAQRHVRRCHTSRVHCFFLGSVAVDPDEEGLTITLDRFDRGREPTADSGPALTAPLPGDVPVPCLFSGQESREGVIPSEAELKRSISALQAHVSGRQPLDLGQLLKVRGRVSCRQEGDGASLRLDWSLVCPSVRLDVHPVRPVPIIPTALLRSLSGANADRQRRGFLTMDESGKLLLLLESDPKVSKLPLVGVWMSGVSQVRNPHVCAWCLRFLFGSALQDRVLSEERAFLLLMFASARGAPDFFRCGRGPSSGAELDCRPLSASRRLALYQGVPARGGTLEFELTPEGPVRQVQDFQDAQSSPGRAPSISERDSGVEDEDWSPRPSPRPHLPAQQAPLLQPAVPELSMLLDDKKRAPPPPLFHSTPDPRPPLPHPPAQQPAVPQLSMLPDEEERAPPPPPPRPHLPPQQARPTVPELSAFPDEGERAPPLPPPLRCTPDLRPPRPASRRPPAPDPGDPGAGSPLGTATESCAAQRLLSQQERQLRLLQAQVQMLLEAQGPPPKTACAGSSSVAVATGQTRSPGACPHLISPHFGAASSGASLLWSSRTPAGPPPSRDARVAGREPPAEAAPRLSADGLRQACACDKGARAQRLRAPPPDRPPPEDGKGEAGRGLTFTSGTSGRSERGGPSPSNPSGTAISLGYVGRPAPGPAPSPSDMSAATHAFLRRYDLLAGPPELPRSGPAAEPGSSAAPAAEEPALAPAGNILDLSRLRRLPKLL